MKRKILSGLMGLAMLGGAAGANAFLFTSASDLNGSRLGFTGLNSGGAGFGMALQLVAGDTVSIDWTSAAHSIFADGGLGLDYMGNSNLDFVRNYNDSLVFSGSVNTSYVGQQPTSVAFGGAAQAGGVVTAAYAGAFSDFPLLGLNGYEAGTLTMAWSFSGQTGNPVTANMLNLYITESGMGMGVFEQALWDLSLNLTGVNLTQYGGNIYAGDTVAGLGQPGSSAGDFNITAVPEPASLALLGLGIAGLGFMRRRKS